MDQKEPPEPAQGVIDYYNAILDATDPDVFIDTLNPPVGNPDDAVHDEVQWVYFHDGKLRTYDDYFVSRTLAIARAHPLIAAEQRRFDVAVDAVAEVFEDRDFAECVAGFSPRRMLVTRRVGLLSRLVWKQLK